MRPPQGDYPAVARRYEEALAVLERTLPSDDDDIGQVLLGLAYARYGQGRNAAAESLNVEAARRARLRPGARPATADALISLVQLLEFTDRSARAEPFWREGLAMTRTVHEAVHPKV